MASTFFFVMIKPDGVQRHLVGEIISRFEKRNFTLHSMRMLTKDLSNYIKEHYSSHSEMHYYDETINFVLSGPIVIMKWFGNIQVARSLVGSTIPWEALPGTIRGDYTSSFPENLIHCSHSPGDATRELEIWKPLLG